MERSCISYVVSVIVHLQKPALFAFMLLYYRFNPTRTVQKWLSLKYSQYVYVLLFLMLFSLDINQMLQ
jgi:formate-dependent nitrite reductase membrane component NrfD